jgi:hypothetical protein
MARKYSAKKRMNKIEPAVQTMTFTTDVVGGGTPTITQYLDLSQVASLANRRFYRQGINWAVAGIKILNLTGYTGTVQVSKLPNTWILSNAWEKGFRAWMKMIKEATDEADSIRPRFLDFKIYADNDHAVKGSGLNLLPVSYVGGVPTPATAGEWDYSTFEIPLSNVDASAVGGNSVTRDVVATGASYVGAGASGNFAVSLIEGYASSRALPNIEDPNMPDDASSAGGSQAQNWMTALFNEGNAQDSEVIQDLETQNNIAPYPFENDGINVDTMYPGGANQLVGMQIHDSEFITPTTIGGTTRIKGGNFPCGLVRFDFENSGSASALLIHVDRDWET